MADDSLITKAHLRMTAENLVEKLMDTDSVANVFINEHNQDSTAHPDIRQAIEDAMYTHPEYTAQSSGLYKITVDDQGHVSNVTAVTKADITALGIPGEDTDTIYTHPEYTARTSGLYKITVDDQGHISNVTMVTKDDIVALGIPAQDTDTVYTHPTTSGSKHIPSGGSSGQILRWSDDGTATWGEENNTTYSEATTSAAGLMSAADKSKLDGIEAGATAGGSGGGAPIATATSSDGVAYIATVDGINALATGQMVMFVSSTTSASTAPTLDINSLGAKTIKRRLSGMSSTTAAGYANNWLYANKPQLLMYDGTYWITVNQDKPQASDLYGDVAYDPSTTGMAATTMQAAVDELFISVSNGKAAVASAITDKGVTTANDATFETMADNVSSLVIAETPTISVSSAGLITATSAGLSATKQLTTQAAKTVTPSTSAQTAVASGRYTTGAVTVAGDANLLAENIKSGVSIFGVAGALAGGAPTVIQFTGDGGQTCTALLDKTTYGYLTSCTHVMFCADTSLDVGVIVSGIAPISESVAGSLTIYTDSNYIIGMGFNFLKFTVSDTTSGIQATLASTITSKFFERGAIYYVIGYVQG